MQTQLTWIKIKLFRPRPFKATFEVVLGVPGEIARELAKFSTLIIEKSESHDKKVEEIRNTTERKIANIVSQITDVENRLCFLEAAREKQEANSLASTTEVEILRQKVDNRKQRAQE